MKKIIVVLTALLLCVSGDCYAQRKSTAKRKTTSSTAKRKTKSLSGETNGHAWVDLGLPSGLKWAINDVKLIIPDFYAWGENDRGKKSYDESNSLTHGKSVSDLQSRGIINANGVLNKEYDVATKKWGSPWRMPTKEDWEELLDYCRCEWTTQQDVYGYDVKGYKITGKNGKSIFLPAEGRTAGKQYYQKGEYGYYWSSTVIPGTDKANRFRFDATGHNVGWHFRYHGLNVRAVTK